MQIVDDATVFATRRSDQRAQLRLQQRLLPFARFQQHDERDRFFRQLPVFHDFREALLRAPVARLRRAPPDDFVARFAIVAGIVPQPAKNAT